MTPIRRVRAVVLDLDGGDRTLHCLSALLATEWDGELEVVLVDNGSQQPVTDVVARRWPSVRVVRSATNRGFAGGANLGIGDPTEVDAIALVNNDAVVAPGWLQPLAEVLDNPERIGAACPKILLAGQVQTVDGQQYPVINNVGTVLRADWYGVDRGYLEPDRGQYDRVEDVEAWCGGAVLLRSDYLRDVGLFDERLFVYCEDLDLSLRGRRRSWRYRLVPSSVVEHEHSATAISGSDFAEFHKERNRLVIVARYGSRRDLVRVVVRFLLSTASYARRDVAAPLLRGERPNPRWVRLRLRALAAFIRLNNSD